MPMRLELKREESGLRHYLYGEPVHCGTSILLACIETTYDDENHRTETYTGEYVSVRYEASIRADGIKVTLYADVGGYLAEIEHTRSMSFKWPERRW